MSETFEAPHSTIRAPRHLVATADHLATSAGNEMFDRGGNAVDAAIAANAAIAVTGPHLCGMGGDLFALVYVDGEVTALNSSGAAGSGSDAAQLRAEGHTTMPFRGDVRTVTVPGCIDGWIALHDRFGSLPLAEILEPAQRLAADGFPASPLLVGSIHRLDPAGREQLSELVDQATRPGARVRRPGAALALAAVAAGGRDAFYRGAFGEGLLELGNGVFAEADLEVSSADWVQPLSTDAFGVTLHTIGPNSQGYLTLAPARLVDRLDLPTAPHDPQWAHLLIEAAIAAGRDRPDQLHERADGNALLAEIDGRLDEIDPRHASGRHLHSTDGDTTYLCTAGFAPDGSPMAVSLIQSNASGFGSHLVEPTTAINLHNRGLGFNLIEGHPAELGPGRRPPHTLAPALATRGDELAAVFGTMGGDAQPQILLQIAARLFHHGQSPGQAIRAGRWALRGADTGFDTWTSPGRPLVDVEGHASEEWMQGLTTLGHHPHHALPWDVGFGHAHAITLERDAMFAGAADPRTRIGSCAGG
ncbi:MAG: gamma-glutamyltransferase [Actinomycetota bacterium]